MSTYLSPSVHLSPLSPSSLLYPQVNARYVEQDYAAAIRTKNDFILVAERQGHVVGFVQYYFQHFTAGSGASQGASSQGASSQGASQGPKEPREKRPARPVVYVATLQAATKRSHPDYCAAITASAVAAAANEPDQGGSSREAEFEGAEPRTGLLLMALAAAHGFRTNKHFLFLDATPQSVPFYRRFFNMDANLPVSIFAR